MRAVWLSEIPETPELVLSGEAHHHLVNVLRMEADEELLVLDGKGLKVSTSISAITKREVRLSVTQRLHEARAISMDLLLGTPKRDALELCLKQATELGFRRIYLVRAAYSQQRLPEADRLQKLLISALEQSNAPYLPELHEVSWSDIPWSEYGLALLLDSQNAGGGLGDPLPEKPLALVVGPEGGFDRAEHEFFRSQPNLTALRLPTPILRTPTALAAGAGVLLQRLIDRR